jgi:nucleotide-binding universal stress UspA family protein
VVLHVLSPPAILPVPDLSGAVWTRVLDESRAAAQRRIMQLTGQIRRRLPGMRVQGILAEGQPEIEIVRAARRLRCDAILLATHGRTGLAHILIGSVAERVLRMAPCPVLVVRHPSMRSKRA